MYRRFRASATQAKESVANSHVAAVVKGMERFSHDVTAAMLMSQTGPMGVELFSYANAFFCCNKFA